MNYETISGLEFRPPERHERTTRHSVQRLVRNLFPVTQGTGISASVEEVLDVLDPLCGSTRIDEDAIFFRGNSVPRMVLDGRPMYAPVGYREIPIAYQAIEDNTGFVGEGSDLANAVVRHLAAGPDVDIMVRKKPDISDTDMFEILQKWSKKTYKRFWYRSCSHASAPQYMEWEEDPRYTRKWFSTAQRGRIRPALRVDIGEAPDEDTFRMDGRLSLYARRLMLLRWLGFEEGVNIGMRGYQERIKISFLIVLCRP